MVSTCHRAHQKPRDCQQNREIYSKDKHAVVILLLSVALKVVGGSQLVLVEGFFIIFFLTFKNKL